MPLARHRQAVLCRPFGAIISMISKGRPLELQNQSFLKNCGSPVSLVHSLTHSLTHSSLSASTCIIYLSWHVFFYAKKIISAGRNSPRKRERETSRAAVMFLVFVHPSVPLSSPPSLPTSLPHTFHNNNNNSNNNNIIIIILHRNRTSLELRSDWLTTNLN